LSYCLNPKGKGVAPLRWHQYHKQQLQSLEECQLPTHGLRKPFPYSQVSSAPKQMGNKNSVSNTAGDITKFDAFNRNGLALTAAHDT